MYLRTKFVENNTENFVKNNTEFLKKKTEGLTMALQIWLSLYSLAPLPKPQSLTKASPI